MAHIEQNKCQHKSKIAPMMRILNIEVCFKELISRPDRAELAGGCGVWISEITTRFRDELLHEVPAGLSGRRIQFHQLNRGARDVLFSNGCHKTCQKIILE